MIDSQPASIERFSHQALQQQLAMHVLPAEVDHTVGFIRGEELGQDQFAQVLTRLRNSEPALVPVADGLMGALGYSRRHPLRVAAVDLSAQAVQDSEEKAAYHNHRHTLDVVCNFWRLGTTKAEGLKEEDIAIGLLAALGHDLGYDPSKPAALGERELKSARLTDAIIAKHVTEDQRARVSTMIAGTELTQYPGVRHAYFDLAKPAEDSPSQRTARMTSLLVRSDLAASTATTESLNRVMSENLSAETGIDRLRELTARKDFVGACPPYTEGERERHYDIAHAALFASLQNQVAIQLREGPEAEETPEPRFGVVEGDRLTPAMRAEIQQRHVSTSMQMA